MKNKHLIILLLLLTSFNNYAHKDLLVTKTIGNIKINISTGFHYEEINKALIIGEYAKLLSEKMNFKDTITIFFRHIYIGDSDSKCEVKKTDKNDRSSYFVTYQKKDFDFKQTLNIVEYIIKNKANSFECDVKKIEHKKTSHFVKKILDNRINRPSFVPELKMGNDISYYVKKGKYYIYDFSNGKEIVRLTADDVFQISYVTDNFTIVFNNKNSFYFLNKNDIGKSKNILFNCEDYYVPYIIKCSLSNSFTIELSKLQGEKKILQYRFNGNIIEKDKM
jgi:hypothetical protein